MTTGNSNPAKKLTAEEILVGVDIGGTNSVVGAVDSEGRLVSHLRFPTMGEESATRYVARLILAIEELRRDLPVNARVSGIAIASPAANAHEGIVDNPANLNWGRVELASMVHDSLDVPVTVVNDSDAAVMGEARFGVARGLTNVLLLTLGTGLGAGIIIDGRLVRGANSAAGEFGHITLDPEGRDCACGRQGCAETYVSATGLKRTVFEMLGKTLDKSPLRDVSFNMLTAETVSRLAASGDTIAKAAFDLTGEYLGRMLANIVAAFDPQAVVLGGGLVSAGNLLVEPARRSFDEHVLERYRSKVRILISTFNDGRGAVLGAASLVREMSLDAAQAG